MALIPLNTFKTKTASLITGSYDRSKCARDTALIIDSIAFDLLFGGTSQSNFAGLQYWAQGATRIPQETLQTLAAMDYAKNVASQVIAGTFPGQVAGTPGSAAAQQKVIDEFDLISSIIEFGTAGTTNKIIPNGNIVSDQGMLNAANILLANKEVIKDAIITYIDQTFITEFTYDKNKCRRDTKLIVDSIAFDLLFDGSSQSEFAGLQYWGQGVTQIPSEQDQTLAAIAYAKSLAQSVVQNIALTPAPGNIETQVFDIGNPGSPASVTTIGTNFDVITGIITNGVDTISDDIVPNGNKTITTGLLNAYELLQENRTFIQSDVIAWITNNINTATPGSIWQGFTYDSVKCFRDVGYIVDCVSFDLVYGGNRQSVQAGAYYYGFDGNTTNIPDEQSVTIKAFTYLKSLIDNVIQAQPVLQPYQTIESQVTNLPAATLADANFAAAKIDIINTIIDQGPGAVGARTPISLNPSEDVYRQNAFALVLANRDFLAEEVVSFVDNITASPYIYNRQKCARDTKLIVDSLAFDLLYGGTSQTEFAGLQYWGQGVTQIPFEQPQTLAAINYAKTVAKKVVRNESSTPATGNTLYQIVDTENPGNLASVSIIDSNFTVVTDIITNGVETISDNIIPNGEITTQQGIINAYELLQANKRYIQNDVISWVNDQINNAPNSSSIWNGFIYNSEKCFRDVGFIIDCISFDLLHGGNRQSVQAGSYYYGFASNTTNIPGEQSVTVTAFNYLKTMVGEVVRGNLLAATYQTVEQQVLNAKGATSTEADFVMNNVGIITNIIENGPDVIASERTPIGLTPISDIDKLNGFRLLIANKEFLAAEVIAYIDNLTQEPFSYDSTKCRRDIGYILDCIAFDLRYGGNRQAIQSGVYYFDSSSTVSIVPVEKTDTIEAYTYLRSLLPSVIRAVEIPKTSLLQDKVVQINNLTPATQAEAAIAQDKVDVILDIIDNGPTAELAINIENNHDDRIIDLVPTFESPSVETDVRNAFNLLLANRAFLTAEVIGFMDTFKVPKNTKVYTSPPGVTAIVLMAQVANVTDHDIKVTFSHYRNLPIISDPSTENGYQAGDTTTEIVKEFTVPPNDSASLLNGRMIIESFDSIIAYASENDGLKLTLSILETATT